MKEERNWKVSNTVFAETSSSHSRGMLFEMPWGWYAAALLLVLVSIIIALIKYPSLPDVIVTHYDANMQPNAWADKSLGQLLLLPIMNLVITASLIPIGIIFVRAKLQIDQTKPALSFAQHKLYRRKMGNAIGALVLSTAIVFMLIGFTMLWPEIVQYIWLINALWIIPTGWLIYQSIHCGQGGCKLKTQINRKQTSYGHKR